MSRATEESRQKPGAARAELRSLARGGSLNFVGFIISGALGFVLAVVVARGLGAEGAGVFFAVVAVFTILGNVSKLGADTGIVRAIARFRTLGKPMNIRPTIIAALVPVLVVGVLAGAAVFFFAPDLARNVVRDRPDMGTSFLRLLAPFLPFAAASRVALAGTRGFNTMVPFVAVESIGKPSIRPIAILVSILAGLGSGAIALSWAVPEALAFLGSAGAMLWLLRREEHEAGPAAPPARSFRKLAREFWRFSAPRGLAAAFQITVIWLDILLVGIFRPTREVGIYAAASRAVTVGTFALQAIRLAIAPQISVLLAKRDRENAQVVYQTATWWLMALSWPLYLTLAVFAPFLLQVFGKEFVEGSTPLLILSLAMLVNLGTGNVTVVLLMGGRARWNLLNTAVSLTLNVGLNLILIPRIGISGAAIAWSVSIIVDNTMAVIEVWLFMHMRPLGAGYMTVAGGAVVCFGGIGLLTRIVFGMSAPTFVAYAVVSVGLYAALLWRAREALRLRVFREALAFRGEPGESRGDLSEGG